MFERVKFIQDYQSGLCSLAELCRKYAISRKTAYKWIERFECEQFDGLKDRSRAAHNHPNALDDELEQEILDMRAAHPTWGARKLLAKLAELKPHLELCAHSTAWEILKRHGLSVPRRRRRHATPSGHEPFAECMCPNQIWCADFKGWFECLDGSKCYPLTISDADSRFLLRCQILSRKTDFEAVWPVFESVFRQYGVPQAIRTDNGPPFASSGLGGLTRLSVCWILHGITHQRIEPGKPSQNGRHERMHKTLKAETASPPAQNPRAQQKRTDQWRTEYNEQRPHEALGQRPPASVYQPSCVIWTPRVQPFDYGREFEDRRQVLPHGQIKWRGHLLHVNQALGGQQIALKRLNERYFEIYFRHVFLGILDDKQLEIIGQLHRVEKLRGRLGLSLR